MFHFPKITKKPLAILKAVESYGLILQLSNTRRVAVKGWK
jgi:hypothetical protein